MPRFFFIIALSSLLCVCPPASEPFAAASSGSLSAFVVVSSHIKPFVLALDGFRDNFSQPISISYVDTNPELVKHNLLKNNFSLIVAIGPAAAELTWKNAKPNIPKMVLMVLDPGELLGKALISGVHLRVPATKQLEQIVSHMGANRRVGVMYNPTENTKRITEIVSSAKKLNITIKPMPVHRKQDINPVLSANTKKIDTLLFIPDATVISETTVRYIIKKCVLSKIAVAGYNDFFMEAGAVMSFPINYQKVGTMGAKIAEDVLRGGGHKLSAPPFQIRWSPKVWDYITQ